MHIGANQTEKEKKNNRISPPVEREGREENPREGCPKDERRRYYDYRGRKRGKIRGHRWSPLLQTAFNQHISTVPPWYQELNTDGKIERRGKGKVSEAQSAAATRR